MTAAPVLIIGAARHNGPNRAAALVEEPWRPAAVLATARLYLEAQASQ